MTAYYSDEKVALLHGNALTVGHVLEPQSIQTIVTSPPYFGLRDYDEPDQFGSEESVEEFTAHLVDLFGALRPALRDDGTLWLNLGDSYSSQPGWGRGGGSTLDGAKHSAPGRSGKSRKQFDSMTRPRSSLAPKNLIGVPWRVAFALQADGWILRSDIIWQKPNAMPESVTDRPSKSHEHVFMFAKSAKYYYDADSIREPDSGQDHSMSVLDGQPSLEPSGGLRSANKGIRTTTGRNGAGRNKRDVWTIPTAGFRAAHFATFPPALVLPCILAGSRQGDTVLDPFSGSGTTGMVALQNDRKYVGIDINSDYLDLSLRTRFADQTSSLSIPSTEGIAS